MLEKRAVITAEDTPNLKDANAALEKDATDIIDQLDDDVTKRLAAVCTKDKHQATKQ